MTPEGEKNQILKKIAQYMLLRYWVLKEDYNFQGITLYLVTMEPYTTFQFCSLSCFGSTLFQIHNFETS